MLFLVPGKVHEVHQQVFFFKRKVAGSSNISGMPTFWPPLKEPISVGPQSRLLAWYSEIWWATRRLHYHLWKWSFPRYGWQFLTRWLTSCSSLGNSLSLLSSLLFPSSTSLEASMNRWVTQWDWARTNDIQLALSIFSNKRKMMSTAKHTRSSLRSPFKKKGNRIVSSSFSTIFSF